MAGSQEETRILTTSLTTAPSNEEETRRFRRCRDVYQPINGSGGKPAASPSSPSRFTSAAVKANQAPLAPSATAWRHLAGKFREQAVAGVLYGPAPVAR